MGRTKLNWKFLFERESEPAFCADRRDPAHQTQEEDLVAAKQAEVEQKKQEVREAKAKVKALKKEMKVCRKEMKKVKKQQKKSMKKLDGEGTKFSKVICKFYRFENGWVIAHLDTEEKSTQKPGATVLKTWKVKNIGSTTWSDITIAIFHSGNQSLIVPGYEVIQVGSLEPNDVVTSPKHCILFYKKFWW